MIHRRASIGFYGGVGSVTGANFMLVTESQRILIDCGLVQGSNFAATENAAPFPYDPSSCEVLLVTHAHADHIGRISKLLKEGFRGEIYSTPPTKDLADVMLHDAYDIMREEARRDGFPELYSIADIEAALARWKTLPYGRELALKDDVRVSFSNAGHILGSALITFVRDDKKLVFTGDIGNVPQPLLDPPAYPEGAYGLVMESVYGDRAHEGVSERSERLLAAIKRTIDERGVLIIPAFSIERTQAMLFEITNFVEQGAIPSLPTFLDSPLAIRATEIYGTYREYLRRDVQEQIKAGDDIFNFPKLSLTRSVSASADIKNIGNPKIIIAGSGMSHGGRIRSHEREYLGEPTTTLLLVGYQTVGSVGRLLQDGAREVHIDGERIRVRAHIEKIEGYSGHADRDQLVDFVSHTKDSLRHTFIAMGEERSSLFLAQRLRDYLGVRAEIPEPGAVRDIEW
jgi:metallo-beta-lactamase family protein